MAPAYTPDIRSPIFIAGALRSGTTVFRLMLGSHDEINNPGEGDFIFDHLTKKSTGEWVYDVNALVKNRTFQYQKLIICDSEDGMTVASNFTDQLLRRKRGHLVLSVHRNFDRVAALFPEAKLIHIIRDPRDVARSCIGMGWAGNTYFGIDPWLETEKNWDSSVSLFDTKNVMEITFESLISNPQQQLEEVCGFIGVKFSPKMLQYHMHSTYAAPDATAMQQWKTKLSPREIALVELKAKPLLLNRKYELSGYPLNPPGLLERLSLFWTNKAYKWQFSCRRYGVFNFVMEKTTRSLPRLHGIFINRINEISKGHLK